MKHSITDDLLFTNKMKTRQLHITAKSVLYKGAKTIYKYLKIRVQFNEAPWRRLLWQPPAVSSPTPLPAGNFHESCHCLPSPRQPEALWPMSGSHPAASAPPSAPPARLAGPVWHRILLRGISEGQQGTTLASAPPGWSRAKVKLIIKLH